MRKLGFTLVEVMLVVAIIGIVSVVTFPSIARSIPEIRLRAAVRTVVKAGRYARSMAVLKQKEMKVTFNLESAEVLVGKDLTRKLDMVRIDQVKIDGEEEEHVAGSCSVTYRVNGTCQPYTIKISDRRGIVVTVSVDALSSIRTERG